MGMISEAVTAVLQLWSKEHEKASILKIAEPENGELNDITEQLNCIATIYLQTFSYIRKTMFD